MNEQGIDGNSGATPVPSIATTRADLARLATAKPRRVQNAVANLDRWLEIAADPSPFETANVDVLACTARAVETLRAAMEKV